MISYYNGIDPPEGATPASGADNRQPKGLSCALRVNMIRGVISITLSKSSIVSHAPSVQRLTVAAVES